MPSDMQLRMTPAQDLWLLLLKRQEDDELGKRMTNELWRRYNILLRLREECWNRRAGEEQDDRD